MLEQGRRDMKNDRSRLAYANIKSKITRRQQQWWTSTWCFVLSRATHTLHTHPDSKKKKTSKPCLPASILMPGPYIFDHFLT